MERSIRGRDNGGRPRHPHGLDTHQRDVFGSQSTPSVQKASMRSPGAVRSPASPRTRVTQARSPEDPGDMVSAAAGVS